MEENKKTSAGFKILVGALVGIVFGICAGLGLYAVNQLTGSAVFSISGESKIDKLEKKIEELEKKAGSASLGNSSENGNNIGVNTISSVVTDVTDVVEKVMPSMVSVTNLYEEKYSYWGYTYSQEQQASGSGIIIGENDDELLLVTNYHVVQDCVQLTVQFVDETQAPAYVKGFDSSVDIAVIAVKKDELEDGTENNISIAKMGNSDALKIGEPAIAIGNALGYGQSVTTGVISALNRDIEMENTCRSLIQTNAAINPGNSGGALLNIAGEVIGINSNKIGGETVEGMGYAIPISEVKDIIDELMQRETRVELAEDERGYLGIQGATVDEMAEQTYGIPKGVYVTKVYERSAAAQYGIILGDVIKKVDGQSVSSIEDLQKLLSFYKGGETVHLVISRSGNNGYEEMDLDVTLGTKTSVEE